MKKILTISIFGLTLLISAFSEAKVHLVRDYSTLPIYVSVGSMRNPYTDNVSKILSVIVVNKYVTFDNIDVVGCTADDDNYNQPDDLGIRRQWDYFYITYPASCEFKYIDVTTNNVGWRYDVNNNLWTKFK